MNRRVFSLGVVSTSPHLRFGAGDDPSGSYIHVPERCGINTLLRQFAEPQRRGKAPARMNFPASPGSEHRSGQFLPARITEARQSSGDYTTEVFFGISAV